MKGRREIVRSHSERKKGDRSDHIVKGRREGDKVS